MLGFFKNFFGINEIPDDAQNLVLRFFPLYVIYVSFLGLGSSFIILAFIDKFGFGTAGFLMAVISTAQFLTDYPTGSFSDYIGQRFVLALSLIFLSIAYFIISTVSSYVLFFIAAMFIGFGQGQLSGTFETYLDNNYKVTMKDMDEDRKIYGFMFIRVRTIGFLCTALAFVVGGLISNFYSRNSVFELEGFLLIGLIPFIIYYLKDVKTEESSIIRPKNKSYFYHFKGGFSFLLSSKKFLFLFIGLALMIASSGIWDTLVLLPIYFGYTGSDAGVGSFRAIIWIIGSLVIIYAARLHKKLNNNDLGKFSFLFGITFYSSAILILTFIPLSNSFNILGCLLIFLIITFSENLIKGLYVALSQRVLSVKVPSEKRNSIYSLLPSIGLILEIPFLPLVSYVIESSEIALGVGILLVLSLIGSGFIFMYHYLDNKDISISTTENMDPIKSTL